MNFEKIRTRLLDSRLEAAWDSTAQGWTNTDNAGRKRCILFVRELRDRALDALRPIHDSDQIKVSLAVHYIEIKSQWIMVNNMVNYQLATTQTQDGEAVLRASLMTSLLVEIEAMLSNDDIASITQFLGRPLTSGPALTVKAAA